MNQPRPIAPSPFYISAAWQQQINLIIHQTKYSQNVMLVVAPEEGGKTSFLQHLMHLSTPGLRKCRLAAQPHQSNEEWMNAVVQNFDLTWEGMEITKSNLQATIEEIAHNHHETSLLLIDDAHHLTDEQLYCLLQLIQFDMEPRHQLHLVLLGEPSLDLRLFSPQLTGEYQGKIYTIELEPWTLNDIKAVLAKEHVRANIDQVKLIFERSRGLPGLVSKEKVSLLSQMHQPSKNSKLIAHTKFSKHPLILGVLMGALIGGGYLLLNGQSEESLVTTTPLNLAEKPDNNWQNPPVAAVTEIIQDPMHEAQPAPIAIEENTTKAENTALLEEQNEEALISNELKEEPAIPVVNKTEEKTAIPPRIKEKLVHKPKERKVLKTKELKFKEQKMRPQKPLANPTASLKNYYTLQLLAARNETSAKDFIQQHALKQKATTLRTKRNGEEWYVVVYGRYSDKAAAKQAMVTIPASVKKQVQPWVRGMPVAEKG